MLLVATSCAGPSTNCPSLLKQAEAHYDQARPEQADRTVDRAWREGCSSSGLHLMHARSLAESGKHDGARKSIHEALMRNPRLSLTAEKRAFIELFKRSTERFWRPAATDLERILEQWAQLRSGGKGPGAWSVLDGHMRQATTAGEPARAWEHMVCAQSQLTLLLGSITGERRFPLERLRSSIGESLGKLARRRLLAIVEVQVNLPWARVHAGASPQPATSCDRRSFAILLPASKQRLRVSKLSYEAAAVNLELAAGSKTMITARLERRCWQSGRWYEYALFFGGAAAFGALMPLHAFTADEFHREPGGAGAARANRLLTGALIGAGISLATAGYWSVRQWRCSTTSVKVSDRLPGSGRASP